VLIFLFIQLIPDHSRLAAALSSEEDHNKVAGNRKCILHAWKEITLSLLLNSEIALRNKQMRTRAGLLLPVVTGSELTEPSITDSNQTPNTKNTYHSQIRQQLNLAV
jgi:hypothetical protein